MEVAGSRIATWYSRDGENYNTANEKLEEHGLKGRIVRAAYTGVAVSNMGSGARTIVSLFCLKTSRG